MANETMFAGFDEGFDIPELWHAITDLPPGDALALYRHLDGARPRSSLVRGVHSFADDAWQMLFHLAGHRAGAVDEAHIVELVAYLLTRHSQAAVATGFAYHVKSMLSGDTYDLSAHVCEWPFEQIDILEKSTHLCCASWLHKSIGDLSVEHHQDVWTSDAAEAVRQSILDGSYRFCNKIACPKIAGKKLTPKAELALDPWWANVIENHIGKIDRKPTRVNLAYDRHCNLACPSCRTAPITSDDEVRDRLDGLTQRNVFPLLEIAREAFITGSGDPFASRTFRKILGWISKETCPELEIILMTNGMLFTEKEWAKFPNLRGKVKIVKVSLDGATKETHEALRRGSKWETMSKNLPFIGSLIPKGDIKAYELVFVVQKENFREMGAFVDLAKSVGATSVWFERITNWGTFSTEQYEEKAIFNRTHALHDEFLQAMTDARLRDPMVTLNSLAEYLP